MSDSLPETLPEPSAYNITAKHAVLLEGVSLERAFHELGDVDQLEDVIRLSDVCVSVNVEKATYSTSNDAPQDISTQPYNLSFSPGRPEQGGLRRARFTFTERLNYLVTAVDVVLVGSQVQVAQPDFSKPVTVLYQTYAAKQKIAVRKVRTMSSVDGGVRVEETLEISAPWALKLIVKTSGIKEHRLHMLKYGKLFKGDNIVAKSVEA